MWPPGGGGAGPRPALWPRGGGNGLAPPASLRPPLVAQAFQILQPVMWQQINDHRSVQCVQFVHFLLKVQIVCSSIKNKFLLNILIVARILEILLCISQISDFNSVDTQAGRAAANSGS